MTQYCLNNLGMVRLFLRIHPDNEKSLRVAERREQQDMVYYGIVVKGAR